MNAPTHRARSTGRGSKSDSRPPRLVSIAGNVYSVSFPAQTSAYALSGGREQMIACLEALLAKAQSGHLDGLAFIADGRDLNGRDLNEGVGLVGNYWSQRKRAVAAFAKGATLIANPRPPRLISDD